MGTAATSTSTTSIPEELKPYFTDSLERSRSAASTPYTPYQGPRVADTNADIRASHQGVRDIAANGMPATTAAVNTVNNAAAGIGAFSEADPYKFSAYNYSDSGTFDANAAKQYMSPYVQNVLDLQKQQQERDYQIQNATRNSNAVQAGAFGGSRQAVQQGLAENDLLNRQNLTEATGLSNAYTDAQKMYEQDRAARMKTDENKAAEVSRVQAGQAGENLSRDTLGLKGIELTGNMANQGSQLEARARAGDIEAQKLLEASGTYDRNIEQQGLDVGYQNFVDQRDWNQNQANNYSNIVAGLPVGNVGKTTETSTPAKGSWLQQLAGAGIAALGAYNSLTGP